MKPRKILTYLLYGILWGCAILVCSCLTAYWFGGSQALEPIAARFDRHVFGSLLVGIACASTPIIYTCDRINSNVQVAIHAGAALCTFAGTAYALHWKIFGFSFPSVGFILITAVTFIAVWMVFYLYHRVETKKINQRLKELDADTHITADELRE